jgi:hypothetical protein
VQQTHQRSLSKSTSTSSTSGSIDAFNLRQALAAFLTPGGLFERLGDNHEKPRDKARESLILLGGYAFKFSGGSAFASKSTSSKGPDSPLATFGRFMKESGFGSKVWRIREQVRSTRSPCFPLRACAGTVGLIQRLYGGEWCHPHGYERSQRNNSLSILERPCPRSDPSIAPLVRPPIVSPLLGRRYRRQ